MAKGVSNKNWRIHKLGALHLLKTNYFPLKKKKTIHEVKLLADGGLQRKTQK